MAESQPVFKPSRLYVVMGTTACGKSTIGELLAREKSAIFLEGDEYHSPENKHKMASGTPLTDEDRWPWLAELASQMHQESGCVVVSCSALKKSYRQYITHNASEPVLFIYLHGSKALLRSRLDARTDHFMNKGLLDSQLATLEVPDDTEFSVQIDIDQSIEKIVSCIQASLVAITGTKDSA